MKSEDYARFTRIVFDTAPTGHTLRLLTVPDFVEASLGKLIRLRKKLTAAGDAVRGLFGVANQDAAIQKLENLRVCPTMEDQSTLECFEAQDHLQKIEGKVVCLLAIAGLNGALGSGKVLGAGSTASTRTPVHRATRRQ